MNCILKKILLTAATLCVCGLTSHAQFYGAGEVEKTSIKWHQIKTEDYRFVYPAAYDSLARTYAIEWEKYKNPVGYSIGRFPNESYKAKMPVILHPYLGYANGMVAWTPRRMEMYTGPDMVDPEPLPWATLLGIHEQRHVSQMQFVHERPLKIWSYFSGEALAGFWSILYFDPSHYEGDAVATETALTQAGRTRTADFLEYYRASFMDGEYRNYERWRYGSNKLYTPDYYKVGYLTMGGMRAVYDKPFMMMTYYDRLRPYRKIVKKEIGMDFPHAFSGVMAHQDSYWRIDDAERGPFQPMERVTEPENRFVSFSGLTLKDSLIYARESGMARDTKLVTVDPESFELKRHNYIGAASALSANEDKIYWAEVIYDPRWDMHSDSGIKYLKDGKIRKLTGKGRYFNPKAYENDVLVCKTGYDGSAYVVVLSAADGEELESFRAPDGMTPFEAVRIGEEILCAAVTPDGEGIYRVPSFTAVVEPEFVKINHLFEHEGKLFFTSDRTSVNELYCLDGSDVKQVTSLKIGGKDFTFADNGYLYFTSLSTEGRMIYRTPVDCLPVRSVNFSDIHKYPLEDKLTEQEKKIAELYAKDQNYADRKAVSDTSEISISEPRKYSKLAHAIKIHSWMPFFMDYDVLDAVSAAALQTSLGLGASVMFQNDLNTLSGSIGYNTLPNGESFADWTHAGVLKLTYSGLYPVFEGTFSVSTLGHAESLRTYVPVNLSSNGWSRGIIPAVTVANSSLTSAASAEIRAYSVLPTCGACIYPHLGIGASVGVGKAFDLKGVFPYASIYGYLPGFTQTQGLGISASYSAVPYEDLSISRDDLVTFHTTEVVAKYAIPFLFVDWNGWSPFTYVKNFEVYPKASFTNYTITIDPSSSVTAMVDTSLNEYRVGVDLDVVLGNLWFIPYDFRVGFGINYVKSEVQPDKFPVETNFIFTVAL